MISFKYSGKPGIAESPPWKGGFVWVKDKKRKLWAGSSLRTAGRQFVVAEQRSPDGKAGFDEDQS